MQLKLSHWSCEISHWTGLSLQRPEKLKKVYMFTFSVSRRLSHETESLRLVAFTFLSQKGTNSSTSLARTSYDIREPLESPAH
ncbi:hypothetical protein GHT06_011763 [Daphnia sinensis]|uniref:Uncharacterized protein n=1 Tax=Daphnia sinensis TaxID=1820382 RepID=A0AAD5KUF8_9CRUS|nr:hypothetical protein GHT06_011763 [Daphnia sinensis]